MMGLDWTMKCADRRRQGCGQRGGGIQAEEREEAEYPNAMAPGLFRESLL